MDWTEGPPEEATLPEPATSAALPPGVRADPPDFPVRNAADVMQLPTATGDDGAPAASLQPVRLLVSRYGDSCLMVVATQLPTLGTMLWLNSDAPRGGADAGPASEGQSDARARVLLGGHGPLHDLAGRRLAAQLAERGWTGPVLLCLGLAAPTADALRALLPRLADLAAQVLEDTPRR